METKDWNCFNFFFLASFSFCCKFSQGAFGTWILSYPLNSWQSYFRKCQAKTVVNGMGLSLSHLRHFLVDGKAVVYQVVCCLPGSDLIWLWWSMICCLYIFISFQVALALLCLREFWFMFVFHLLHLGTMTKRPSWCVSPALHFMLCFIKKEDAMLTMLRVLHNNAVFLPGEKSHGISATYTKSQIWVKRTSWTSLITHDSAIKDFLEVRRSGDVLGIWKIACEAADCCTLTSSCRFSTTV